MDLVSWPQSNRVLRPTNIGALEAVPAGIFNLFEGSCVRVYFGSRGWNTLVIFKEKPFGGEKIL